MTKKLIAPGITGSVWRWENDGSTSIILSGGLSNFERIAATFATANHADNARFLAGSKRVAEAAAAMLEHLGPGGYIASVGKTKTDELRAALLASGYREQD